MNEYITKVMREAHKAELNDNRKSVALGTATKGASL